MISFPLSNLPGAEERARKEAAEKEQELMRQKLQEQQQQMEAQKRSLEENMFQLKEKLERDRENYIREQNKMLEHKLKVSLAVASVLLHGHCPGTSGGLEKVTARSWREAPLPFTACVLLKCSIFPSPSFFVKMFLKSSLYIHCGVVRTSISTLNGWRI